MEQILSQGRFELKHNIPKMVVGSGSTYTFQLVGNGSATVYGSLDGENWNWVVEMTSTQENADSAVLTHTWRYLKVMASGDVKLWGNRG